MIDWHSAIAACETRGASDQTARQDGLTGGIAASRCMAATDWERCYSILDVFEDASVETEAPVELLMALASRESRCGAALDAGGWGDNKHAFGILQIDKRHHMIRSTEDPYGPEHVTQAANILMRYLRTVQHDHPDWSTSNQIKGACVAYNSGTHNVQTVERMNLGTTGNDYGDDVIARAQYYQFRLEKTA